MEVNQKMRNASAKQGIWIVVAIMVAGICIFFWNRHSNNNLLTREVFGTQAVRDSIQLATNVTACRLTQDERIGGSVLLSDYTNGPAVRVNSDESDRIKAILDNPNSFVLGNTGLAKQCILDYGVLVTFQSTNRIVRVAICYACKQLGVYDGTNKVAEPIHIINFDPGARELSKFAKVVFLRDEEIQRIRY